ncbi:protein T6D22.10 [Ostreococcus tauri]|uniref:Protein T6D22.10 n=1 Tax=Ostreococcus tauri TaxID=70448 RepID=A0A1Y5I5L8_OSTTA|nr:protein T6D22.10 [Ostreococcus tauri]
MSAERFTKCDALVASWTKKQRRAHEQRMEARYSRGDFLFFLHVPRTAGRSFHFCFLKPAFETSDLCGNQYMGVTIDPRHPKCKFLATHDDYSLVERFEAQPRMVVMLRKPSRRVLSAYEFSIEVAARSFGTNPKKIEKRVQTRQVWPWSTLTTHIDGELRGYDEAIKANQSKIAISDVYDNELYTPFAEWIEMEMVHNDVHNGQFFQVLGLSNNTDAEMEPRANELRACALRRDTPASQALMEYAKERLEREIDVVALHERLADSISLAAKTLNIPLNASAHFVHPAHADVATLSERLSKRLGDHASSESEKVEVIGFVFRFRNVKTTDLAKVSFRESYVDALRRGVSMKCGVDVDAVRIHPMSPEGDWSREFNGFHMMTVTFKTRDAVAQSSAAASEPYDDMTEDPDALYDALKVGDAEFFQNVIAINVKVDQSYGEFELSSYGRIDGTSAKATTAMAHPISRTVGEQYRVCESGQFRKYARLRANALKHISEKIHGAYETFSDLGRKRISRKLIKRVDDLNFLDYELWKFAEELFEKRFRNENDAHSLSTLPPAERIEKTM